MAYKTKDDSFPRPNLCLLFYSLHPLCSKLMLASLLTLAPSSTLWHHNLHACYPSTRNTLPLDIHKAWSLAHSGLFSNVISSERPLLFTLRSHTSLSIPFLCSLSPAPLITPGIYLFTNGIIASLTLMSVPKGQGLCFLCHHNPSTQK